MSDVAWNKDQSPDSKERFMNERSYIASTDSRRWRAKKLQAINHGSLADN